MGTFSTIGTTRSEVKMFKIELMALAAVMAMATSAIELPDTIQGYGNDLAYYHQQEERNPAFNLDNRDLRHQVDYEYSVPSYNVDYSVPSYYDGSQLNNWWPINSLGAPSPPTIVSSRPHYSNEIEGDKFSQRFTEQGHEIDPWIWRTFCACIEEVLR